MSVAASVNRTDPLPSSRSPRRAWIWVTALVLPAIAAVAAVSWVGVARVESVSMEPSLAPGGSVVFERLTTPGVGDIVLFADPGGWATEAESLLVKRVIGVGGDRIVCCESKTGRLLVNGEPAAETYLGDHTRPGGSIPFDVRLEAGTLWVMGDNRGFSHDSRTERAAPGGGAVPLSAVRGVVRVVLPAP